MLTDGAIVRGYRLSYLAMGGMGVVYRGTREGRDYVLKEVPADQPTLVLALTQEKSILERLDHPQIVRYVGLFEEAGYYYLVVDFIDGQSLAQIYSPEHPMSEAEARNYGMQLCGIFTYLHGLTPPVIHRDVKPGNILLRDGHVFLIDFGIARIHKGDRHRDTESFGSFTAPPEQFGLAETDQRSDVYTLGATLFTLLAHDRLPDRLTPLRELRPDVSPQLEAVLLKAMAFQPGDRYASMADFRAALGGSDGNDDTQVLARPLAAPAPARARGPRPGRARLLGALAGLALFSVALASFKGLPSPESAGEEPDTGLPGSIFSSYADGNSMVVTLGSDIGLFRFCSGCAKSDRERTRRLVDKLNDLYHERCPTCGHMRLERDGFRVGRFQDAVRHIDATVVFYSHQEPSQVYRPPILLATVEEGEAVRQKTTRKYVAAYWRDLIGDMVRLSRGQESTRSVLGSELNEEMLRVRRRLSPDTPGLEGIHTVMQQIGAAKAQRLQHLFEVVPPDYRFRGDSFQGIPKYQPLL